MRWYSLYLHPENLAQLDKYLVLHPVICSAHHQLHLYHTISINVGMQVFMHCGNGSTTDLSNVLFNFNLYPTLCILWSSIIYQGSIHVLPMQFIFCINLMVFIFVLYVILCYRKSNIFHAVWNQFPTNWIILTPPLPFIGPNIQH